jgi:mRNA-degrading endonuclease RelE of RelBE toxin-antitoxin system
VYTLVIERKAEKFLKILPKKTRRIIVDKILCLIEDPFPNGNKEKLNYSHPPAVYRLHIGRSFTVFYIIETDENVIKIEKIHLIERAHKEYSRR